MKLVIGNFKNKLDLIQTKNILNEYIEKGVNENAAFCIKQDFFEEIYSFFSSKLNLLVQNISEAYIDNILKPNKCSYVLLGHSDYRTAGETNQLIFNKLKSVINNGGKVLLCVGESLAQKPKALEVISEQLKGLDKYNFENIVIAYEPIYSIGTGLVAKKIEVELIINFIKQKLPGVKVLYGGSVNSENCNDILAWPFIDGVLVGKASLNVNEFIKIVYAAL